jgi:hypothetical protein
MKVPPLKFYSQPCPRRVRGWNIWPQVSTGACTRTAFPGWTKDDHRAAAVYHAELRNKAETKWQRALARGARQYGKQGVLIVGGFRDDWPDAAKDEIRKLALATGRRSSAAALHWQASGARRRYRDAWISK